VLGAKISKPPGMVPDNCELMPLRERRSVRQDQLNVAPSCARWMRPACQWMVRRRDRNELYEAYTDALEPRDLDVERTTICVTAPRAST
jgi:uncharacterized protein YjiS (DUF1127 family)